MRRTWREKLAGRLNPDQAAALGLGVTSSQQTPSTSTSTPTASRTGLTPRSSSDSFETDSIRDEAANLSSTSNGTGSVPRSTSSAERLVVAELHFYTFGTPEQCERTVEAIEHRIKTQMSLPEESTRVTLTFLSCEETLTD